MPTYIPTDADTMVSKKSGLCESEDDARCFPLLDGMAGQDDRVAPIEVCHWLFTRLPGSAGCKIRQGTSMCIVTPCDLLHMQLTM